MSEFEVEEMDVEYQYSDQSQYNQIYNHTQSYDQDSNYDIIQTLSSSYSQDQEQDNTDQTQCSTKVSRQSSTSSNHINNDQYNERTVVKSNNNQGIVKYNNQQNKQMKQLVIVNIPNSNYLISSKEYLLNGDIFLNFDSHEFNRIGTLNKYKKMLQIKEDKEVDQINVSLLSSQQGLDDFSSLSLFCKNQPHKTLHMLGEQLCLHQERITKIKQFSQSIQNLPNLDLYLEACEKCFQSFKAKCQSKLKEMVQSSQVKFYKTKYVKIDYIKGSYEFDSISMSQLLLALLGISQEQAKQFILRKGMFEFVFSLEEYGIELHCLNLYNQNIYTYTSDIMIKTFDGIDLQCKTNFHILYNNENSIAQKAGLMASEFFMIIDYDITPNMLRQIVQIRKNEPGVNLSYLENEQDWDYSAQSKQFIKQFYPDQ